MTTRNLLIGPGAIGLTVGAALCDSDAPLDIAARSSFDQLHLTGHAGDRSFPAKVVTGPPEDEPGDPTRYDFVFLATKAHQVEGAASWLRTHVGPDTTLVVLQNGVEHEDRVRHCIPATASVVPVVVNCPARRIEPGRVELEGPAHLTVPDSAAGRRVASVFETTFVQVRVSDHWLTDAWIKLLMNASTGILTVLTGRSLQVLRHPDAAATAVALMNEAAVVGRAEGADLPDDLAPQLIEGLLAFAGDHLPSIAADRASGLPTEWDARNQVVVRLAEKHGIDVPLHRMGSTLIRLGEPG